MTDKELVEKANRVIDLVRILEKKSDRQGWSQVLHHAMFQSVAMEIEEYYAKAGRIIRADERKKVVEWFNGRCPHKRRPAKARHECVLCWSEFDKKHGTFDLSTTVECGKGRGV